MCRLSGRRLESPRAVCFDHQANRFDKCKMTSHIRDMPRASTKEQIVTAAVETLHMKGFNATSVEDITNAAKVPKGSFYNHFKSKEDLAVEALDRYWQNMQTS